MSRSKRKRDQRGEDGRKRHHSRTEDRRGDAITVAWMVCTFATACAVGLSLIAAWYRPSSEPTPSSPGLWAALLPLMLFTAATTGLVAFCLTPLVYLVRRVPPPRLITVVALVISLSPLLVLLLLP